MSDKRDTLRCRPRPVRCVLSSSSFATIHSSTSLPTFNRHHNVRPYHTRRDRDHRSAYFFNDCWSFVKRAFLVTAESSVAVVSAASPSFFRSNSMKENTPVPLYLSPWPKPNRTRSKVDFMDQKMTILTSLLRAMLLLLVRANFLPTDVEGKKAVADRIMTIQNSNIIVRMLEKQSRL